MNRKLILLALAMLFLTACSGSSSKDSPSITEIEREEQEQPATPLVDRTEAPEPTSTITSESISNANDKEENGDAPLLSSNEKRHLADEVLAIVVSELEKLWQTELNGQIRLALLSVGTESDRQFPITWFIAGPDFYLNLHEDFDLETTWWNMQPENEKVLDFFRLASLRQKYILVISHEVSHLFMASAPMQPWFQESAAMSIGKHIAVTIDPLLINAFPEPKTDIDISGNFNYSYQEMLASVDLTKMIQLDSFSLTSDVPINTLLEWVIQSKANTDYTDDQILELLEK